MAKLKKLPFREVHLDFHTSPMIPGVGARFSKEQFQSALKAGHVDSITIFSKCHHGWSYHPTQVGKMHPGLSFDLTKAELEACHEIGVGAPIYLSAGLDNVMSDVHPEWRVMYKGMFGGWADDPAKPGFHLMCFRSPYLDYLCDQIREVCRLYPECDGIFLDIIAARRCTCSYCRHYMAEHGLDISKEEDVDKAAKDTLHLYYERTTAAAREINPDMPIFHNSGNVPPGHREDLKFFSHLELESLPTGGWGYDHFPLSAKYVAQFDHEFLGMTGKFHKSWGEFGGFKHPNALRYECAAMLAYGSKCSVGDQMHPDGEMDMGTYNLIGAAYAEVEKKETWCRDVKNVADVGILLESAQPTNNYSYLTKIDIGAGRMLLEAHTLFDLLDNESDFAKYKVIVLPDNIVVTDDLKVKLDAYLAQGGKLFMTGESGVRTDGKGFLFDVGAETSGMSEFNPSYILPKEPYRAEFIMTPNVMYSSSRRITVTDGESLGDVYDPYFNRAYNHFCSHQHTPFKPDPSEFACGVHKGNITYIPYPVFSIYSEFGAVCYREFAIRALNALLGQATVEIKGLPSSGRITIQHQSKENRNVMHILYCPTCKRGGIDKGDTEVVEDIVPIRDIKVIYRPKAGECVKSVRFVPDGKNVAFVKNTDGSISFDVPEINLHAMIEIA